MGGKGSGSKPRHGQRSGEFYKGKRPKGYAAWVSMRQRCTNPNLRDFANYGRRGITYDRRWESYEVFIADMGEPQPGMTLDRIDNMGDYSPDNCRWVSRAVQGLNKRNCVRYELNGKSQTLAEWARETGIGRVTILKRIQAGIPLELALTVKGFLGYNREQRQAMKPDVLPQVKETHAEAMRRPETRAKISAAKKGVPRKTPVSDTHRAALSAAQLGHSVSAETRAKLAAANLGRKRGPHSNETRAKMSAAQKGRPLTPEHRAALCAAQQRRWAAKAES